MRCGVTGLRPTFGRVPRTGAMTLCWSLDKLGPMTRGVEDAMLVLQRDRRTGRRRRVERAEPSRLRRDSAGQRSAGRILPAWMKEAPATDVDRAALDTIGEARHGADRREAARLAIWIASARSCSAEAAAAFEELTLSGGSRPLKAQVPDAWPNLFRQARFLSAVDFVQADRFRRRGRARRWRGCFREVDLLLVPSLRDEMLTHLELHRPSVAHAACRLRPGLGGAERLGAGSGEPAAEILSAAPRAARRDLARTIVRGRHGRTGGARAWSGPSVSPRERPTGF